jgi:hypothetical protein
VVHRFRLVHDVPLKTSPRDVRVHGIASGEVGEPKVPPLRWVTDRRVSPRHVSHLRRGGRARWKMANETCKTLKKQGDHFEHHSGHGTQQLSVVCAMGMRLAVVVEQTQPRCWALLQALWATLGSKRRRWARRRA